MTPISRAAATQTPAQTITACKNCQQRFEKIKHCALCTLAHYCSRECQLKDWPMHKNICHPPQEVNMPLSSGLQKVKIFKPKQADRGLVFTIFVNVAGKIVESVGNTVLDTVKKPEIIKNPLGLFTVNPMKALNYELKKLQIDESISEEQLSELKDSIGLDLDRNQAIKVIKKTEELLKAYFENRYGTGNLLIISEEYSSRTAFQFSISDNEESVNQWLMKMTMDFFEYIYEYLATKKINLNEYSSEEIDFMGVTAGLLPPIQILSCFQYTALFSRSPEANSFFAERDENFFNKVTSWESLGY